MFSSRIWGVYRQVNVLTMYIDTLRHNNMKRLLLLLVAIFALAIAHAGDVTEQEALLKAQQFMKGKTFKQKNLRRAPQRNATKKNAPYYVFNAEGNDGFVIVSGDDRTEAILGYADKGNLDMDNLPDNLKTWLSTYESDLQSIAGKEISQAPKRLLNHNAIAPLLSSQWGQGAPYNAQSPLYNEQPCPTGCVATALAQLMYYHKWPESVGAIAGFSSGWVGTLPDLPATTFNWDQMNNDEVAKLMRYCGQATQTQYFEDESAVSSDVDLLSILTQTFGYDASLRVVSRLSYLAQNWEQQIYDELSLSRPVLYRAFTPIEKGHVFICDGFENGYFHINWGWSGDCDGYFLLTLLDPNMTDNANNVYSVSQEAIIGIKKNVNSGAGTEFVEGCLGYRIVDENKVWAYRTSDYYDNCSHYDERAYDRKSPLIVPSTVTYNNHEYNVTELGGPEMNIYWEESGFWNEPIVTPPTLVMPETLEKIHGGMIIQGYEDIVLTIPANVKYIEPGALFSGTNSFRRFEVHENNQFFKAVNGVVFSKSGDALFQYPNGRTSTEYVVPTGVKTIVASAFFSNQFVESIQLPNTVEGEIGDYAFSDCYGLTSINLPEGITSLGAMSMARIWHLKNITLPTTLKRISNLAFWDCPSIEEITIPGSCEYIGCQAFGVDLESHVCNIFNLQNRSALKKITVKSFYPIHIESDNAFNAETYQDAIVYVPRGSKALYEEAYGWSNFQHIVEADLIIAPVATSQNTTFSGEAYEDVDMSNTSIDNAYFTLTAANGDGYDVTEQAIVLNSTTTATQMNTVTTGNVGDNTVRENFNGIILQVPAGGGKITVDARTIGSHMLNVQIGNGEPTQVTKSERGTVVVEYDVKEVTYVYLYATESEPAAAPARALAPQRAAAENSLLLYGYQVALDYFLGDVNGDGQVTAQDASLTLQAVANKITLEGNHVKAANINGDSGITAQDASLILQYVAGKINW